MIPALACRSRIRFFWRSTLDDLDRAARSAVRKSLGTPSTVPNAIVHHPSFLALESVTGALVAQHFTDLNIALNDPDRGGVPVLVKLAVLQMATRCPVSPLERPDLVLATLPRSHRFSVPFYILGNFIWEMMFVCTIFGLFFQGRNRDQNAPHLHESDPLRQWDPSIQK
ncbi:hypothetical protein BC828DRAFT_393579 [Blastocladiella britannica]|nr:hypothetical protein BC828DRAFT_393579 [Blastocladiella britannica]